MREGFARVISYFQFASLALTASGAVVVGILDFVGAPFSWLKKPEAYMLVLLGLMALTYSLERFTVMRQIDDKLDSLKKDIQGSKLAGSVSVLNSYDEIYDEAIHYLSDAKRHIRAVVVAGVATAPEKYRERLCEVLTNSKKINKPIRNDVVLVIDNDQISNHLRERHSLVSAYYKKKKVDDLIGLYYTVSPIAFDMLIIDERHVFFSYTISRDSAHLQTGLSFVDQPEIASEMARWFDNVIIHKSKAASQVFT